MYTSVCKASVCDPVPFEGEGVRVCTLACNHVRTYTHVSARVWMQVCVHSLGAGVSVCTDTSAHEHARVLTRACVCVQCIGVYCSSRVCVMCVCETMAYIVCMVVLLRECFMLCLCVHAECVM